MLNSFEPPPARVFAWRQLRLMREQGLTAKQARRMVQAREEVGKRCATAVILLRSLAGANWQHCCSAHSACHG